MPIISHKYVKTYFGYSDSDSSEDEGMEDYQGVTIHFTQGINTIKYREIYLNRYVIIQKLVQGHFSTVWLVKHLQYNTNVAIIVQKSAQHYLEAAYDEVEILQEVSKYINSEEWENQKILQRRSNLH